MLYINPSTGVIYSGSKSDGSIPIPNPPSNNYKLKQDWHSNLDSPWELDLASYKESLVKKAKDLYDKSHEDLIFSHYPKFEPFSWAYQKEEAEEWVSLSTSNKKTAIKNLQFSWLFNSCYPDGGEISIEVIDSFANKVIDNSKNFKLSASKLLGIKRSRLQKISEASTEEELLQIEKSLNENN